MSKKPLRGEFELGEEHASPGALNKAKKLASEANTIESKLEVLDNETSLLGKRLVWIKQQGIPEALRQAGISHFTGLDGREVEVKDAIFGTLPKEDPARSTAIAKLDEYGLGGIIRTIIEIDFPKEDREEALKLFNQLRKRNSLNVSMKEGVHHQTFLSNLRHRLEDGLPLDARALGIAVGYDTKFYAPKKKKGKKDK